ncbi:MAG: amino acid permease [Burkholderiales bacterium]
MAEQRGDEASVIADDIKTLHGMGYAQELSRRMRAFSNFAISFSIICILSGGINSVAQGIAGVGGGALGIGWPIGVCISLVFALALAQISSSYPTAGGLYHWGSILGGVGWGWVTAWLNLIGLITVLGAINVGTWQFFIGAFGPMSGIENNLTNQAIFLAIITAAQALVNHLGIRLTTLLTDFSGYLIFFGAIVVFLAFMAYAKEWDFSRLWTFKNYSGTAGGDVWPESSSVMYILLLGLLLPIYTITGYDASAHTSEETVDASRSVPKGMVGSVIWSGLFGWLFLIGFTLAIPNMDEGAKQGWNVFFWTSDNVLPGGVKLFLYVVILVSQYLCGLATVTSASRMIFAFSRDGGMPFSSTLKKVSPTYRTPVAAIWTGAVLAWIFTLYTPVYATVVSVTVIFLFLSFAVPIFFAMRAYGNTWTKMGPWDMGPKFKLVAALCLVAMVLIFLIGIQPPSDKALWITIAFLALTAIIWFAFEKNRFQGPPQGVMIQQRAKEIEQAERAVGEKT